MKYYEITPTIIINGEVAPGMNGETVKGKELLMVNVDQISSLTKCMSLII